MKVSAPVLLVVICFLFTVSCSEKSSDEQTINSQQLTGPYLGLVPPGDIPELFAPGIVADIHHEHSAAIFSPDGKELFWTFIVMPLQSPAPVVVMHMKENDGAWAGPDVAEFVAGYDDDICSISPDGNRLYIASRRPKETGGESLQWLDIWVLDKTGDGWSEPRWLDVGINSERNESSLQETISGNLYFLGHLPNVRGEYGIFVSEYVNGEYLPPQPLPEVINSENADWCPYIDPDERFLLFSSNRPGGYGGLDLFISFRSETGGWNEPINLGDRINTASNERYPYISPDGKYLFFLSNRTEIFDIEEPITLGRLKELSGDILNGLSNIYWVDSSFIEELNPH